MGEINQNVTPELREGWPTHFEIIPSPIRAIGRAIKWCVEIHQLASHGDHRFDHPFDRELYDERPPINEALLQMNQVYFPDEEVG